MAEASSDLPALAVFDIDGVLADVRHRLHHLATRPKDWAAFFDAAGADPPLEQGRTLCLQRAQDCEVVYVTGRPERCREDTLGWLARQGLPSGQLCMRADRDRRPARLAKPELLRRLARDRVIAIVVDDDEQVCASYEDAGWPVLLAGWMDGGPLLHDAQESEGRT